MPETYWRFIRNFFLNRFGTKNLRQPLNAQIELTLKCNAKCSFCEIWRDEYQRSLKGREMTTEQVKKIIDDLNDMKITVLSLTGGEPTLRRDLKEIIDYSASKGIITSVATNGSNLIKLAKKGVFNKLSYMMISLDYPDAERHDKNRGIPGLYNKIMKGIKIVRKLGVKVIISMVVTKDNIDDMEEMAKLALKNHCIIEMLPCEDIVREVEDKALKVEDIKENCIPDLHKWAANIRKLNKKYPNITTDEVTVRIIENGGFGQKRKFTLIQQLIPSAVRYLPCHVAMAYIFVKYDGKVVFPCKLHPVLQVDALKYHIADIYRSPEVKAIQDMHDGYPFCKGCRLGCAIVTSIPMYFSSLYEKYIKAYFKGNFF
ncbi:MAG: radical SAM protein [Promethearchaeota archaeon]